MLTFQGDYRFDELIEQMCHRLVALASWLVQLRNGAEAVEQFLHGHDVVLTVHALAFALHVGTHKRREPTAFFNAR